MDYEVYRLLTAVYASPALASRQSPDHAPGAHWDWLQNVEGSEVSRLLVSIAAMARNGADATKAAEEGCHEEYDERQRSPVGRLVPDLESPGESIDLSFREACNKVLHALSVQAEREPGREDSAGPLTGFVNLYGEHRGKRWRARIDIPEFALTAPLFLL